MPSPDQLQPYSFTKENQPSPESKRKPKFKSWCKKQFWENEEVIKKQIQKGDFRYVKEIIDHGFGKVKETTEIITPQPLEIIYTPLSKEDLLKADNVEIHGKNKTVDTSKPINMCNSDPS